MVVHAMLVGDRAARRAIYQRSFRKLRGESCRDFLHHLAVLFGVDLRLDPLSRDVPFPVVERRNALSNKSFRYRMVVPMLR